MDSIGACSNTGNQTLLGAGHWVFASPDAADRQIELEPVARQCILYFQFACVINSIVRALLEIGKHAELQQNEGKQIKLAGVAPLTKHLRNFPYMPTFDVCPDAKAVGLLSQHAAFAVTESRAAFEALLAK